MIALAHHRETTPANQPQGHRTIAELTKTISASRLATWQRCRLQFYFRYVAGIQKSPTPALHIGTTVHTVLQQWNLARWHGRDLEIQELKEIFSRAWMIWQDGEQIDWEGKEETVKAATFLHFVVLARRGFSSCFFPFFAFSLRARSVMRPRYRRRSRQTAARD